MVALNVIGVNLIAPVLPAYAAHFGVGFVIASSLITAFALARMSFRLVAGRLSDAHGSRRICAAGGLIQAGGALLGGFAPGIGVLLIARAIQGSGSAMFGTSINRYLLVTTEAATLGRATAGYQSGILVGSAIGPFAGGVIADRLGIFAPFFLQAAVAGLLAALSMRLIVDRGTIVGEDSESVVASVKRVLGLNGFRLIMMLGFGLFFIRAGATNVLLPAFADETMGLSTSVIGAIISLGAVVSLIVMPVAGRLADRIGRIPLAVGGAIGASIAVAMYGFAVNSFHLGVVAAVTGIGVGLSRVALPTMVGDLAPRGTEGLATGVFRIANDMGWVIGPLALGYLADGGRFGVGFAVAGVPLFLGGLLLAMRRDRVMT